MAENLAADQSCSKDCESSHDDSIISMVDVLNEEQELENDATAVLGDSDCTNCTYPMGYIPRQAIYSCLTCCPKIPAGICLACSYECHEGHNLCELYTKRNFCCDCGNSKFGDSKCKLFPNKTTENTKNMYSQNFKGVYCTCERPYPDPDDEVEDEMLQCVLCEDWYHGRHLGMSSSELPGSDQYDDICCVTCMQKYDFLWAYNVHTKEVQTIAPSENNVAIDVVGSKDDKQKTSTGQDELQSRELAKKDTSHSSQGKSKVENVNVTNKEKEKEQKKSAIEKKCLLKELQSRKITVKVKAAFWKTGWRSKLCTCSSCMAMYKDKNILFLIDETDTIAAYESRGKAKQTAISQYDKGLQALSTSMDRVQQVEVIQGFNDMKTELREYLKKFAENGKVVREEDIREFFSQMEARKRKKTGASMQYFCK